MNAAKKLRVLVENLDRVAGPDVPADVDVVFNTRVGAVCVGDAQNRLRRTVRDVPLVVHPRRRGDRSLFVVKGLDSNGVGRIEVDPVTDRAGGTRG